jgi:CRISPR-associated protein Cmr2
MKHLLSLSVGPVQEFIAAARKTADLQAGSELLVQITREAAKVVEQHGRLIFPARADAKSIPNKILAELNDGADPAAVARDAENAARDYLLNKWHEVTSGLPDSDLNREVGEDQIAHFLEFYAAWLPRTDCYAKDRDQVERLMAGRKALRDFTQPKSAAGSPKSPLDPSRDCVLRTEGKMKVPESVRRRLSLKKHETLDAVSVLKRYDGLKRAAGGELISTSMLAAKPALGPDRQEGLDNLKSLASRLDLGRDYSDLLFPERTRDLLQDKIETGQMSEQDAAALEEEIKSARKAALGGKECSPYYAILVADGDHMGARLATFENADEHLEFSEKLATFAQAAADLVKRYDGYCVYSGGDDVLAFVPVHRVLDCAEAMATEFGRMTRATLSIGVAIVHHLEDLQVSVERAREAEKAAKKMRNALAVALHTRGGALLTVAESWTRNPVSEWKEWIQSFGGGLARGFPYELLELAREWPTDGRPDHLRKEAERILARKEGVLKPTLPSYIASKDDWMRFAGKLVIARFLANYSEVNHA